MSEYDYFIAGFQFTDAEFLRQLIVAQPSLVSTYSTMETGSATVEGIDGFNISVFFTAPLSDPAQTLLAGLMATYITSVPVAKLKKLAILTQTVQDFIELKYPLLTRVQLLNLYNLAKWQRLTARAAYIKPGLDWLNSILAYALTAANAINALSVLADVNNYVIDIVGNVSADPLITLGGALSLTATPVALDAISATEKAFYDAKVNTVIPAVSTPSRTLDSDFTPSASQSVMVFYTIRIATSLLAGTGSVELLSDTSSTPTTLRSRVALTATINSTQDCVLSYLVPAGHKVHLSSAGTATISIVAQSEVAIVVA